MSSKTRFLLCAAFLATLIVVQARFLGSSYAMEREEMCSKNLSQACPGSADVIPFAYGEPEKIDETCTAATKYFPCFQNYNENCVPKDVESRYFLTYLSVCDRESPLYEGIRKSKKCINIAEKAYNKTCVKPMEKLEAELEAFESKISDHGISSDDWDRLEDCLITRQSMVCYMNRIMECDEIGGTNAIDTVEEFYIRIGDGEKITYLLNNQAMVDTVLDNLNMDDEQKKWLRGKNGLRTAFTSKSN